MIQLDKDKQKNSTLLNDSIQYLEERGYEDIKADLDGYETPLSFTRQSDEKTITPDITATRNGVKHIFEIGVKSEKPRLLKTKWKLLDMLSEVKQQRFNVITTKGHIRFTQDMMSSLKMQNNMIRI